MALNKVTYQSRETIISAQNLNDIQDNIIINSDEISDLKEQQKNLCVRNLLRNGDFTQYANTQAKYAYDYAGYTFDGWYLTSNNYLVRKGTSGYITIVPDEGTNSTCMLQQYVKITDALRGKTVTLAAKFRTPKARLNFNDQKQTTYQSLKVDSTAMTRPIIQTLTYTIPVEGDSFWVAVQMGNKLDELGATTEALSDKGTRIYWVALFLGEYTSDTLPFLLNDYDCDLLKNNMYEPDNTFIGLSKFTGSPPNLLDNSSFIKTRLINQRGYDTYDFINNAPLMDRWYGEWGDCRIELTDNGLKISNLASDNDCAIRQNINVSTISNLNFSKYYTIAAKINDQIIAANATLDENSDHAISATLYHVAKIVLRTSHTTGGAAFEIVIDQGVTDVIVEWAAVYEGRYEPQTLPEYHYKNYDEDLAICQKYYKKYTAGTNDMSLAFGSVVNGNLLVSLPIGAMAPVYREGTLLLPTLDGITNLAVTNGAASSPNVTSASIFNYDPLSGHITLSVKSSATLTNSNIYKLVLCKGRTFTIMNDYITA